MAYKNYKFYKQRLNAIGYGPVVVNDDPAAEDYVAALKKLQKSKGFEQVGYVGPKTIDVLIHNAYPKLPLVPFQKTTIDETLAISYLKTLKTPKVDAETNKNIVASSATIWQIEGAHGKYGVCNNFVGVQTDGDPWPKKYNSIIIANTITDETMSGNERRFAVFTKWQDGMDMLVGRLYSRGLYVNGHTNLYSNMDVSNTSDLAKAYWKEWVQGDNSDPNVKFIKDFKQLYNKTFRLISA